MQRPSDRLLRIDSFVTGPLSNNTYLVSHASGGLVIDPGAHSANQVLRLADELGLKVQQILNTHGHWDHIADDAELMRRTGAALCVHALDAAMVRRPPDYAYPGLVIEPSEPGLLIEDGSTIDVGGFLLRVLATPGHTPGSVCVVADSAKAVFTGDTLFAGTHGRVDLPGGDATALFVSLRRLAALPEDYTVYPGHGPLTTIADEMTWLKDFWIAPGRGGSTAEDRRRTFLFALRIPAGTCT